MKKGFTLIELLVVVLIIGILASIAVPQYNKAVMKARTAEVMTTANAFKKAMQIRYLSGPIESLSLDDLDIQIPELKYHNLTLSKNNLGGGPYWTHVSLSIRPRNGNYRIEVYAGEDSDDYYTQCHGSDCKFITNCAPFHADVGCSTYACSF